MKKRKIVSAPKDFDVSLLPQNRKDQFFNLLKNQYFTIFKIGLLLLLFLIPFLACDLIRNLFDNGFYNSFLEKTITEEEYHFYLFLDLMIQTGIEFVFIPLLSVAIAGFNGLLREMVEGGNILFFADFKIGVKNNYKITLIVSLVFGAILAIVRFVVNYFIGLYFVMIPVYSIFILFIIPLTIIPLIFTAYYQGNYFNVLNNSMKLYPSYWWQYLLISSISFGVVIGMNLGFDGNLLPYLKTIVYAVIIIIVIPLAMLLLHSISISLFDKRINPEYYPENLSRGLYVPKSLKSKKHIK